MRRSLALYAVVSPFALLSLVACGSDSDDSNGGGSCTAPVTVKSTYPANNATDAYWRGPFQFELSAADATAKVTADFAGTQGTLEGGKILTFTPNAPLSPKSAHTMTLTHCGGTKEVAFTVSDFGTPLASGTTINGRTWQVDVGGAHYSVGAGLGSAIDALFSVPLLVHVYAEGGGKISLRSGLSKAGSNPLSQDFCGTTVEYPDADFSKSPYFVFGPTNVVSHPKAGDFTVYGLKVEGTISSDGSKVAGAALAGTVDADEVAPTLMLTPTQVCDVARNAGSPCGTCPHAAKQTCISLLVDRLSGTAATGTVEHIAESDTDARCMP